MRKILPLLYLPFKNLEIFILILLLTTSIDIAFLLHQGNYKFAIYLFFHGYTLSYLLCLFINLLTHKLSNFVKTIIITVAFIFFIADIISICIYHERFNQEFATILIQTNISEASEFIKTYLSVPLIAQSTIAILLLYISFKKAKRYKNKGGGGNILFIGVPLGIFLTMHNPLIYKESFIGKITSTIKIPTNIIDLRDHLTHPIIIHTKLYQPANIIMLFGESFSKSHSSLYDYPKITNPLLATLIQDSLLYVYKNVESPALGTFPAFKCIMSTYKSEYRDSIPWYKCTTIPELVKCASYKTFWISNQSKIGLFDTAVGRYADLCDEQHFTGDKFSGMRRYNQYDELILDILPILFNDTTSHKFYFIQLMGSHFDFKHRYPPKSEKYHSHDYINYPEHQRNILAAYDNSIVYNDSIVYEIMNLYKNQEAIIFYFSDHAIDIFESSDDYVGHARGTDSLSTIAGKSIPFMIYTSPLYQKKYPEEIKLIQESLYKEYNTDDMIYTIMDIIGIKTENILPKEYSILHI